jgi:glutamine cyclotransferase
MEFHEGVLYEGAGKRGESMVLIRSLESIEPVKSVRLEKHLIGEGITILDQRLYQLTWQSQRGFIYDASSLALIEEFKIQGQGWGMTNNGRQLIISNGSNRLTFLDPTTFNIVDDVEVRYHGRPIDNLNELEWIDGVIYANIWRTDWIVMIDPETGNVTGTVSLKGLLPDKLSTTKTDVLNGIAYDDKKKRLFVTGKYWPRLYHIELAPVKF